MARVRRVSDHRVTPLAEGWQFGRTRPGALSDPWSPEAERIEWLPATVPCTAASALRAAGRHDLDDTVDFDADDWWWRCVLPDADPDAGTGARVLRLEGLATLAEVWLNGAKVLASSNMFAEHAIDVGPLLRRDRGRNELRVGFRALGTALLARRPRPRWRTRLVSAPQLRWFRTTLYGRIPAWSPAAAAVGPWRNVWLEERPTVSILRADLRPSIDGPDGRVDAAIEVRATGSRPVQGVRLRVGDCEGDLTFTRPDPGAPAIARGSVRLPAVERWWPHTHGRPTLYPVSLDVLVDGVAVRVELGRTGFREVVTDTAQGGFTLRVNGVPIFCRGACWTPLDPLALIAPPATYRATLDAVRDAGMNMVRVGGPFFYEDDAFYDLCDELGILVWHDFPFANMDYPADDPGFVANVEGEVRGFLDRTQLACSVAVLCGNSEVEQQAAMMGAPRALWRSRLFSEVLPRLSSELRPDVAYWASTPSEGALPFSTDSGTAHYFGVGAYLRPLEDARRADVRFATECLAFANVPDDRMVEALRARASGAPPTDPLWKRGTPRDGGAGWDFEDVRDHYLRLLFDVDPARLRYADVDRYLALSRVVTGEVMATTFAEWRRTGSPCGGALVWFLRDLRPGAGWGVLDADGHPKAAYHYLRRVLQPVAVLVVDEGLNGIDVHVVNDTAAPIEADLDVTLFRGEATVAAQRIPLHVAARDRVRTRVAGVLETFVDATYAYRFGPVPVEGAVAVLTDRASGACYGQAFHFPRTLPSRTEADVGLRASAVPLAGDAWRLRLTTRRLAQAVVIEARGFSPEDNHVHVAPGVTRDVLLRRLGPVDRPEGSVHALNVQTPAKILLGP